MSQVQLSLDGSLGLKKRHHCLLDLDDLLRCQSTHSWVDIRPFDGCELAREYVMPDLEPPR
jgi:hypothetical protein